VRARVLPRSFYQRDARELAPLLLNKVLVHRDPVAGRLAVRLVEVEAYAGADDPASHGYRGPTPRTTTMFGAAGRLYVYFTYGMHWCMNVVAGEEGVAGAVLLRGGAPLAGIDTMRSRRVKAQRDRELCSGPARMTQALGISGAHDGTDLLHGPITLVDDGTPPPPQPSVTTRIGLKPGEGDTDRWRWFVAGEPNVSRGKPSG
jgi:DNA-3-methyladenine glycosylase